MENSINIKTGTSLMDITESDITIFSEKYKGVTVSEFFKGFNETLKQMCPYDSDYPSTVGTCVKKYLLIQFGTQLK